MRACWLIVILSGLYFAFSVWAFESHGCEWLDGGRAGERIFWCEDLRYLVGIGYFVAPIVGIITLSAMALRRLTSRPSHRSN
jgi:hypothetical protein